MPEMAATLFVRAAFYCSSPPSRLRGCLRFLAAWFDSLLFHRHLVHRMQRSGQSRDNGSYTAGSVEFFQPGSFCAADRRIAAADRELVLGGLL
jgi:hypothetical protein